MKSVVLLALVLATAACSIDMNLRMGHRPDTAALERRLHIGESSTDDVLAALGPPDGKGAAMLPIDQRPSVMWLYTYSEGPVHVSVPGSTTADPRTLIMFVFFDGDRYQGYLWASSLLQ
jgi:hypothetical protein